MMTSGLRCLSLEELRRVTASRLPYLAGHVLLASIKSRNSSAPARFPPTQDQTRADPHRRGHYATVAPVSPGAYRESALLATNRNSFTFSSTFSIPSAIRSMSDRPRPKYG